MRTADVDEWLVSAAQAGDRAALDQLVADCLPLVYNLVGRAMDGHPDVDDVVQETLLRVLGGISGLREPSRFRSWLVAIATNEVRRRWSDRARRSVVGLDAAEGLPDPGADFAETTVLRLGLSGQRRELAEATRWLEAGDRALLSLWWLEASGRLTRAEVVTALEVSAKHTAVRIQRMKEHLDTGRAIVGALRAEPPCPALATLTAGWDGRPAPVWRKRIARHLRTCKTCGRHRTRLTPAESLLAGLALLPPPPGLAHLHLTVGHLPGAVASHLSETAGSHVLRTRVGGRRGKLWHGLAGTHGAVVGGTAAVVAVAVAGAAVVWSSGSTARHARSAKLTPAAPTPAVQTPTITPTPSPTPSPHGARHKTPPPPVSTQAQVVALVNAQRARHGCAPVRLDTRLQTAAQQHSQDMATHRTLDHNASDGTDPGKRITLAGYRWSAWGENIAAGQATPGGVMRSWMDSPGHRANILNCRFTGIGVGIADGPGGPWWTQDFATPL